MSAVAEAISRAYDVEAIRSDFPILSREVYGKPLTYLDNAASAQKPRTVIDAVSHAYSSEYANVHRGLHFLSNAATEAYESARETVRAFINAAHGDEIIFTANATAAINLVASSYGGTVIGEGDEIVLSIMEHHSNIVPWNFHREHKGAVIKWAPVAEDGSFRLDQLRALLTPRTRMVAITHMSNVLGTVVPINEVCRIAHERGIAVLIDGSQGSGPPAGRRSGNRLRFLRLHRSQAVRSQWDWCSLRETPAAECHAALRRRRRNDRRRYRGSGHLRRSAPAL